VVAKRWRFKLDQVRQRFRLTSTEKRVVVFVLAAFVLGLVTKCYRDAHPSPAPGGSDRGKARPPLTRTTEGSPTSPYANLSQF